MRELHDLLTKTAKNLDAFVHPRVSIAWQDRDLVYRKVHNPSSDIEESIVGKKLADVVTNSADVERLTEIKKTVLQTGQPYGEMIHLELGERRHYFDISIEPTYDEHGQIDGLMSVNIDITDLMEAREQLKKANTRLMGHLDEILNLPSEGPRTVSTKDTKRSDH